MSSAMRGVDSVTARRSAFGWLAVTMGAVTVAGCATTGLMRNGQRAEDRQDYDQAVVEYTRALQRDPDNADASTSLRRAKLRASQDHFTQARRHGPGPARGSAGRVSLAAELNPASGTSPRAPRDQNLLRAKVATDRNGKTELEALVDRMRDQPAPGLELPAAAPLPDLLTFRNASNQDIIRAVAQMANVNVIFDPAFRPTPISSIDFRNMTFEQVLGSVLASTQNFFRVTAPQTITVIPDTPAKRREYEAEVVRPFSKQRHAK